MPMIPESSRKFWMTVVALAGFVALGMTYLILTSAAGTSFGEVVTLGGGGVITILGGGTVGNLMEHRIKGQGGGQ